MGIQDHSKMYTRGRVGEATFTWSENSPSEAIVSKTVLGILGLTYVMGFFYCMRSEIMSISS